MPVIEQEFDSSGDLTMTRMNVLGARGIEAVINVPVSGSATMNWLMVDGHGNVVRTMNTNFGLSAYQWRGVWGERQTGTLQTRKGYVANLGHQEDETGLVYMRARYYEPTTGRFISEDPARDGVNWYLYADGNPVNKVDASGTNAIEEVSFLFYILGVVFASAAIGNFYDPANAWSGKGMGKAANKAFAEWKKVFKMQTYTTAQMAIICFSIASVGLVNSSILAMIVTGVQGSAMIALEAMYGNLRSGEAVRKLAGGTLIAATIYCFLLLGLLISIGVDA